MRSVRPLAAPIGNRALSAQLLRESTARAGGQAAPARALQRKVELRRSGPGTMSAYGRRKAFVKRINRQARGTLFHLVGHTLDYTILDRDLLGNFERELIGFIDLDPVVPLLLVTNAQTVAGGQPVLVDNLARGFLDLDDLLACSDASFQLNLIHILRERFAVPNYGARLGTPMAEGPAAHGAGIKDETQHLRAIVGDSSIVFQSSREDKIAGTALFQFRSRGEGYHILHSFRLGAGGRQGGHVVVVTRDHRRLPLEAFIAERNAGARAAQGPAAGIGPQPDLDGAPIEF